MSTTTTTELTEPFVERVNRLFRELERAIKWDRPAILLAVYSSEFVRADAEVALTARLSETGQTVTLYRVAGEENADIPLEIAKHPDRAHTVFFISGLRWGGGPDGRNAYRALNIRREYFVEEHIRAVFWLTESEAIALPRHAPDFWAFRHRVVEFVEPPEAEQVSRSARELTWRDFDDRTLQEQTDAKIELREALLRDLPEASETLSIRADLLYTLAGLYSAKGDYEQALALCQNTLGVTKQLNDLQRQGMSYHGLGNIYRNLERYQDAIVAYQRAIELRPKSALPHNSQGNVYHDMERYEDAIAEFQRAIELDPKHTKPHNGLGNVYRNLGRYEDAIAEFQRAIELDPKDAYLYNGLGNVYYGLERIDEAITAYQRAIELDPKDTYSYNGLGNVYYDLERTDEAIAAYQRAIELDPKYARPHNSMGNIYHKLGRTDEAIATYQRAIELDPKYARPHNGLGNLYADLGRTDEAISAYQRAIELDPKYIHPHTNLGNIYRDLGRTEEANAEFQRTIELDPGDDNAHNNLGNIYADQGRTEEAITEYQHAIELDPIRAYYPYYNQGNIYARLGRTDKAIAAYQRAVDLEPKRALARISLASCYRKQGRKDRYEKQIHAARQLLRKENEYGRALFYLVTGNKDRALDLLKQALQKNQVAPAWVRRDPDFQSLRDDPRFKALVWE